MLRNSVFLFILFFMFAGTAYSKSEIVVGNVYEIKEEDLLILIKKKAESIDWSKVLDKKKIEKKVKNYVPAWKCESKPRARETKEKIVDITSAIDFDVKDRSGNILYPAGYKINPLEYVSLPNVLLFIDTADPEQEKWLLASKYKNDIKTIIMLTGGNYYELAKKIGRMVYYAPKILTDKLQIERVPSVAVQKGTYMKVTEVAIDEN